MGKAWRLGWLLHFFKSELLKLGGDDNFLSLFPFFNIHEVNLLGIDRPTFDAFTGYFTHIIHEQKSQSAFSLEMVRANLHAVLWLARRVYEQTQKITPQRRAAHVITSRFQFLVNEHFAIKAAVEDYAELLNITPNHLSQTIKAVTGKTAKGIIAERRLAEAKYLLSYMPNEVAQISDYLNFSEPTHFTKFFKKETGITPVSYRMQPVKV